jgi:hypothetical protein
MNPTVGTFVAAGVLPAFVFALAVLLWGYSNRAVTRPWLLAAWLLIIFVVVQQAVSLSLWLISAIPPVDWPARDVRATLNRKAVWREVIGSALAVFFCIRVLIVMYRDAKKRDFRVAANDEQ